MDFGLFLLLQSPSARPSKEIFARGTEITCLADELGYHSVWLAEHHFSTYGYLSRPLTYALHLANQTRRIRVGTAVVVLPLHNPLVVDRVCQSASHDRNPRAQARGRKCEVCPSGQGRDIPHASCSDVRLGPDQTLTSPSATISLQILAWASPQNTEKNSQLSLHF